MSLKRNIPLTRADHIRSYRKKHAAVRHEYLALATKHSHLDKCMLTFTASGRGRGVYTKLRLINEVKKHIVHLINVTKADIYHFTSIEMGHSFSNPHLHLQLWHEDFESVQAIYDKVIEKFSLNDKYCKISTPSTEKPQHYHYVIKDYSKDLSDDEVWNLEQTKKRMRKQLGMKLKFYSRSKSKYTQKTYRVFYKAFNVIREKADRFIEWFYSLFFRKDGICKTSTIFLSLYRINRLSVVFALGFFDFLDLEILFYAPSNDPPLRTMGSYVYFKGVVLFLDLFLVSFLFAMYCFPVVGITIVAAWHVIVAYLFAGVGIMVVEVRCLSPPMVILKGDGRGSSDLLFLVRFCPFVFMYLFYQLYCFFLKIKHTVITIMLLFIKSKEGL